MLSSSLCQPGRSSVGWKEKEQRQRHTLSEGKALSFTMSDCVSTSPPSLSIARQLGVNSSTAGRISIRTPVGHSRKLISFPKLSSIHRYAALSPVGCASKSKRSSGDGSFGELGFETSARDVRSEESLDFDRKAGETLPLRNTGDGDLVQVGGKADGELKVKKGRKAMRRSSLMAKQVICLSSALSLGYVSQLWVDTTTWVVLMVEVRPNLISGESERFLLEEIRQVGDVVLVEDENVLENDLKILELETLVGYEVVTPGRRSIGKVRGYTFNIYSGAVESLEMDSFGISIIPSSLVSTYALFLEDVLEVASDKVIVHEAAASRIQRLTKGLWDNQKKVNCEDDIDDEYFETEKPVRPPRDRSTRRGFRNRKFQPRVGEPEDDWDLPMDFS